MGSILTVCDERSIKKPRYITPRKITKNLQIDILKIVAEVTDLKTVNFAKGYHFAKNKEVS